MFSCEDISNVMKLGEGFERSEIVDVNSKKLIAYLTEDRVVELEE